MVLSENFQSWEASLSRQASNALFSSNPNSHIALENDHDDVRMFFIRRKMKLIKDSPPYFYYYYYPPSLHNAKTFTLPGAKIGRNLPNRI